MLTWKSKQEGRHHFCSHGGAFSSFFFRVARRARRTPSNFGVLSTALEAPFRNHPPVAELRKKKKRSPACRAPGKSLQISPQGAVRTKNCRPFCLSDAEQGSFLIGGPQENMACPFPLQNQPIRTSACFCALYELLAIFREASKRPWELWNQLGPSKLTRCLVPS